MYLLSSSGVSVAFNLSISVVFVTFLFVLFLKVLLLSLNSKEKNPEKQQEFKNTSLVPEEQFWWSLKLIQHEGSAYT